MLKVCKVTIQTSHFDWEKMSKQGTSCMLTCTQHKQIYIGNIRFLRCIV